MKKYANFSIFYFALAMVAGVFYREYTKYAAFTGRTTLAFLHVHLLVLGMIMFLVLVIMTKLFGIDKYKGMNAFMVIYNIGLLMLAGTLTARGIVQVKGTILSAGANGALSGIAGISHLLLAIGLLILLINIKKAVSKNSN